MSTANKESAPTKAEKLEKEILWAKHNYRAEAKATSEAIGCGSLSEAKKAMERCDKAYAKLRGLIGKDAAKEFARQPWSAAL